MSEKTKKWFHAAAVRAVRTVAQTAVATIGAAAVLSEVNSAVVASLMAVRFPSRQFQQRHTTPVPS